MKKEYGMRSRVVRFVVWGIWTAFLAGCTAGAMKPAAMGAMDKPMAAPNTVVIDNFTFEPSTLEVARGTTVTWINKDDVPHTVTSDAEPRLLNSKAMDTDERYTMTFSDAGTFAYFCKVHPHMTGKVIVK